MATNNSSSSGGIGFVGLLTVAFIVLKLLHKISWPWVWVLSPIWIGTALVIVLLVGGFGIYLLIGKIRGRHGN